MPRFERPFWVAEQLEVALFEGLHGRLTNRRIKRKRHRWILPDYGLVDQRAVQIAVRGERRVCMTRREQRVAAARVLARGGTTKTIAKHLYLRHAAALWLTARIWAKIAVLRTMPGRDDYARYAHRVERFVERRTG